MPILISSETEACVGEIKWRYLTDQTHVFCFDDDLVILYGHIPKQFAVIMFLLNNNVQIIVKRAKIRSTEENWDKTQDALRT